MLYPIIALGKVQKKRKSKSNTENANVGQADVRRQQISRWKDRKIVNYEL
jgi:hypothetical protein